MPRPPKTHRGSQAWKKDILRLTTLLRLRCQPAVPYPIIANLLLKKKHGVIRRLVEKCAPERVCSALVEEEENAVVRDEGNGMGKSEGKEVKEVRVWLERYLKQGYESVERDESALWKVVRGWDVDVVREMFGKLVEEGLLGGERYRVMGDEELKVQMQWRRGGDWKVGSEPFEVKEPKKPNGAQKRDNEDEAEVYDGERIKFFEDMVADIVDDDTVLKTLTLEADNEGRKRRKLRCSVGAPPWSEVPVYFYNEKRVASNCLKFPTEFQTAYEMNLEGEHQKLLYRLEDVNEKIASYKREVDVLSKKRTGQASRDFNEKNPSSKASIKQAARDFNDRLSSSSIEKKMSKVRKIFEESSFSKTENKINHATKNFDDSSLAKIENTIKFQHTTENLRQKLEEWEEYKNDDGESDSQTSSSKLKEAAEKAFTEWQRNDRNQGWLEMFPAKAL